MQFETAADWVRDISRESGLHIREVSEFVVLTDLSQDRFDHLKPMFDNAIARVQEIFPYLNFKPPYKKWPVFLFDSQDLMAEYYAHVLSDGDESMMPGGVWVPGSPGYFLMPIYGFDSLDAAMSHELIHAALDPLPTPRWFEEGIACNVEMKMGNRDHPFYDQHSYGRFKDFFTDTDPVDALCHGHFHDPIKSEFLYNLSQILVINLLKYPQKFELLIQTINREDCGRSALNEVYGWDLIDMVSEVVSPSVNGTWLTRLVYRIFGYH